jgi:hypothetical protein
VTHDDGSNGRARPGDAFSLEQAVAREPEPAPEVIAELAESAREYVSRATGVELDYSPETLPVLDHYVSAAREGVEQRPDLLPLLARAMGAYFGEILRRVVPSFWLLPSADAHEWRLCACNAFLSINPVGFAYDALFSGIEHDGPSSELAVTRDEQPVVEARLEELPPVPEDQYYLLSTRLEVVQVAFEALRLQMEREGIADVTFEPADYEADD